MNRVKEIRKVLRMSQQELSLRAGVSTATIVLIERYGYLPGPIVRAKFAAALGAKENVIWPELQEVPRGK